MAQQKVLKLWFLNFIWKDGAHRVASLVVFSPMDQEVMGASDIYKYYLASHLRAVVSWSSLRPPNRWTEIEMGLLFPAHPCSLVWSPALFSFPKLHDICLGPMLFSLKIWRSCYTKFSLSSPCPSPSNVLLNLIPDTLSHFRIFPWAQAGLFQLPHFVHPVSCKIRSFSDL